VQIVVMAKEPRPGFAKTRLCPPCTPDEASRIARASLSDTLRSVRATPAERHVLALDGDVGPWLPEGYDVTYQVDGPLGRRLDHAMADAFLACAEPVVIIGMDTPQVRPADLLAIDQLLLHDDEAVLGPASDGGWWALGLRRHIRGLFDGVEMSVESTGRAQADRLAEVGYSVTYTSEMRDVDCFEDAQAIAALVPDGDFASTVATIASVAFSAGQGGFGSWPVC
jgi:uncharacterized protein